MPTAPMLSLPGEALPLHLRVRWEGVSACLIGIGIKDLSSKKVQYLSSCDQIRVVLWEVPLGLWLQ